MEQDVSIISFDVEGTVVTPEFSEAVWHEGVPDLYARSRGISFEEARAEVRRQYDEVGEHRMEWYDVKWWFERLGLGDYRQMLERYRNRIAWYPEARDVLASLGRSYRLIVISSSTRVFLPHLLDGGEQHFSRVFSTISDYGQVKTPDLYRTVCRELGIAPETVVHVGDSYHYDYETAREAGIRSFHLDRSGKTCGNGSFPTLIDWEKHLRGYLP